MRNRYDTKKLLLQEENKSQYKIENFVRLGGLSPTPHDIHYKQRKDYYHTPPAKAGIFCLGGLITCIVKTDGIGEKLSDVYKQGQVDALTNERVIYEPTIHGYKVKEEYLEYTNKGTSSLFMIDIDEVRYSFYLKK